MLRLVALRVAPTIADNDSTNLTLFRCVVFDCARTCLFSSQSTIGSFLFWCCLCCCVPDARLGLSTETLLDPGRRFVQESLCGRVVFISDEPADGQNTVEVPVLHSTDHSEYIPVTPRVSKQFTSLSWETSKPQDKACFWRTNWCTTASVAATA